MPRLGVLLVLIQQGRAVGGDGEGSELPGLWETRIAQLCFRDHTAPFCRVRCYAPAACPLAALSTRPR